MKKPFVLIAAIVAVLGLCAAVAVGDDTTKVRTSVSMKFTGTHPSGSGTFVGKVKAEKGLSGAAQGRFLLARPREQIQGGRRQVQQPW